MSGLAYNLKRPNIFDDGTVATTIATGRLLTARLLVQVQPGELPGIHRMRAWQQFLPVIAAFPTVQTCSHPQGILDSIL